MEGCKKVPKVRWRAVKWFQKIDGGLHTLFVKDEGKSAQWFQRFN